MGQALSAGEVARRLRLGPSSLESWQASWRRDRLPVRARGRPARRADRDTRNLVVIAMHLLGPGVGVPTLQNLFPGVARSELADLARRYRNVYRRRRRGLRYTLRWTSPGTVWAMDFTESPLPIDGDYPYILVVRDLSSGAVLAALPTREATAEVVCDVLRWLFMAHGAPLVLKSDNGSHFANEDVARLLDRWSTMALLSPPGTPAYNGACEAGIGGLKTRAHDQSTRHGRPGQWTCDDVETARLMANETARPWGLASPTPDQAWRPRVRVAAADRDAFVAAVATLRPLVHRELYPDDEAPAPGALVRAQIERVTITRALIERDCLQLRRRRFTLSITQRAARKIT
jgi:transposase InsO family protein